MKFQSNELSEKMTTLVRPILLCPLVTTTETHRRDEQNATDAQDLSPSTKEKLSLRQGSTVNSLGFFTARC